MKKISIIFIVILALLALSACGASEKPDADPYGKMAITDAEYTSLLAMWPLDESIESHGTITSIRAHSQNGTNFISLNASLTSTQSSASLVKKYKALISGEWENNAYSVGPSVYGGKIGSIDGVTCQISRSGSPRTIFLGLSVDTDTKDLDALIDAHWPIGLIPAYKDITSDMLFMRSIDIDVNSYITINKSWRVSDTDAAMAYYKEQLADYDSFAYDNGSEYTAKCITCKASNIDISISPSNDMGTINITYGRTLR